MKGDAQERRGGGDEKYIVELMRARSEYAKKRKEEKLEMEETLTST